MSGRRCASMRALHISPWRLIFLPATSITTEQVPGKRVFMLTYGPLNFEDERSHGMRAIIGTGGGLVLRFTGNGGSLSRWGKSSSSSMSISPPRHQSPCRGIGTSRLRPCSRHNSHHLRGLCNTLPLRFGEHPPSLAHADPDVIQTLLLRACVSDLDLLNKVCNNVHQSSANLFR